MILEKIRPLHGVYDAVLFDFDGVVVETPRHSGCPTLSVERTRRSSVPGRRPRPSGRSWLGTSSRSPGGVTASASKRRRSVRGPHGRWSAPSAKRSNAGLRSVYDDITAVRSLEQSLGIVSDNHPTVISTLLERFGLRPAFETVYGCPLTPDGLSRRKPDPTNIEAAIADLEAESALYVGDRAVDVRAADNAGLESALLSRSGDDDPTEMDAEPTYHLSSLSQLPAILR